MENENLIASLEDIDLFEDLDDEKREELTTTINNEEFAIVDGVEYTIPADEASEYGVDEELEEKKI